MRIKKIFTVIMLLGVLLFSFERNTSIQAAKLNGIGTGPDVLILAADSGSPTGTPIQTLLQGYGNLGSVDMFIVTSGYTPTLPQLLTYDVVITWNNGSEYDYVSVGDILADYVDWGGKVINLNYSMGTTGYQIQGRFLTGGYSAINGTSLYNHSSCLGSYLPSHSIMAGITNVCDAYRMTGTYLTNDSYVIAQWDDSLLFVAAKNDRSVVSINGYVGYQYVWTDQMDDLLYNAILWLTTYYISYCPLILK